MFAVNEKYHRPAEYIHSFKENPHFPDGNPHSSDGNPETSDGKPKTLDGVVDSPGSTGPAHAGVPNRPMLNGSTTGWERLRKG